MIGSFSYDSSNHWKSRPRKFQWLGKGWEAFSNGWKIPLTHRHTYSMPTLNWIGKEAVINHHNEVPFHLLEDVPELSVGDPGSGNLIVEGDNLLALKALLPYYAGQVKCIYIDPPYNTGNESWVYNDNVNSPEIKAWLGSVVGKEAEDLSRHDKWLCMMYPRLALLREMLSEDGAIFVSIDDNEVQNLRYLMDAVFGARNFIATIIWEKVYSPKSTAKNLSENHDYVILYAKQNGQWARNLLPRTATQDKRYKNPDNDSRGPWKPGDLSARNPYSQGIYSIESPSGRVISGPPKGMYWRVSKENLKKMDADGRIWWGKSGNNVPAIKRFLSEVKAGVVPQTIWTYKEAGHTQEAKKEVVKILPDAQTVFMTPKPTRLLRRIMQLATDKDSIVMDSFAGSGTLGQAVLEANREDAGNRRFVMVELDHEIATKITAPRVQKCVTDKEGFRYAQLTHPLFNSDGRINEQVKYAELARHVFFSETGEPLPGKKSKKGPLLDVHGNTAIYLLYNGILKDKKFNGGNVLTSKVLTNLPSHEGSKIIYGTACRLSKQRLKEENIVFQQIPYEIRTS